MRRLKIALVWLILGAIIGAPVALAIVSVAPSLPADSAMVRQMCHPRSDAACSIGKWVRNSSRPEASGRFLCAGQCGGVIDATAK